MGSQRVWHNWATEQNWTELMGVLWGEQIGRKRPALNSWEPIGLSPCQNSVVGVYWVWVIIGEIFLRKACMGEWCLATDGASVSQTWGSIWGSPGGKFWEWGLAKGLGIIWMQRIDMGSKNGRFIVMCSLLRRSCPINVIGHWGTTIKDCVSVVLQRTKEGEVILG